MQTAADLNPFRYRSYYYDAETEFYYCNSRYYDPQIYRWLNVGGYASIGQGILGHNMFIYCGNDPVNMVDPSGNWPALSTVFMVTAAAALFAAAVAITVVTCGVAVPALAIAGGGVVAGVSATSIAAEAVLIAGISTSLAVTAYVAEQTTKRSISVYVLKDEADTVQYVERTNNVERRRTAHNANPARAGLKLEVIASGLNLPEARALEQAGMSYYHTINTANKMNNQINGVSPKYWGSFKELALGMLKYGWNQMSNEILFWTGN